MKESDALIQFKDGVELLKNGYPKDALPHLRNAVEIETQNPYYLSFFGLAMARAEKKWNEATHLCETALQLKGKEPQFHLNLAEVYVAAGRRASAARTSDSSSGLEPPFCPWRTVRRCWNSRRSVGESCSTASSRPRSTTCSPPAQPRPR